jgi:hypothetical protein
MVTRGKFKSDTNLIDERPPGKNMARTTRTVAKKTKKKVPVALRFDVDLLAAIDAMAARRGTSRNAIISYWCSKSVESE